MAVVFSGTEQGSFVSTGANTIIQVPTGIDWIYTFNYTKWGASSGVDVEYFWQNGMANGLAYTQSAGNALGTASRANAFIPINNTINNPGPAVAITAITSANPAVVSTGSTAGFSAGNTIVRLINVVGGQQLGGIDYTIGTFVANTSFQLQNVGTVDIAAPATTGFYRIIPFNPYFYPSTRTIANLGADSTGNNTIVTMTVTHFYTVGQTVRLIIPTVTAAAFGSTQLNQVQCDIIAIGAADANGFTNTITVDVPFTNVTAFAWPLTANKQGTPAQVVPVGERSATAIQFNGNFLGDSEINQGFIGMQLAGGATGPAGQNNDVIYWVAGKSFNGL